VIQRSLQFLTDGTLVDNDAAEGSWTWFDLEVDDPGATELFDIATRLELDPLAIRDAINEYDLPKVDDFGHNLLVVLHGLREDVVDTYEVDCFLTADSLVTVHGPGTPALEALWNQAQQSTQLASGGADHLLARLADVLTRRLLAVMDLFDDRSDDLIGMALAADPSLLEELTAIRTDVSAIRRVVHPQREALDLLRQDTTPLISSSARRRFSDVFDVANRAVQGLDNARGVLAETLDAYRGAEARRATDVTKVLTIYAAIMLPLSLVTGFFGMNFSNLPGISSGSGWILVTVAMIIIATVSLGIFISAGWIKRPSGRQAGRTLGLGLIEAARAPVHVGGAVYEITTMPLRGSVSHGTRTERHHD
jgi:magnesium transporter